MNQINMDSKKNYKITSTVLRQLSKTYIQPYLLNNREYTFPYKFYFLHSLIAMPFRQNKMPKMNIPMLFTHTFFKEIFYYARALFKKPYKIFPSLKFVKV